MSMKSLYDLREKFHVQLDEISRKPEMSTSDLEIAHKLTDTIKNIDKIRCLEEGGGYSQAGEWEAEGRMSGNYGHGYSAANRGQHYVRGHYSRADGREGINYRRGRYSHDDGRSEMMEHLEMALDSADERDREAIRRFMRNLENV